MYCCRKFFYATTLVFDFKRLKLDTKELASLAERRQLRDRLKCRNFEWYLHNVVPEMVRSLSRTSLYTFCSSVFCHTAVEASFWNRRMAEQLASVACG